MKKKELKIQVFLFIFGIFLIIATYFYYPNVKKNKVVENQTLPSELVENQTLPSELTESLIDNNRGTSFEKVEYRGYYDLDKPFEIQSEKAYIIEDENSDIIYMINMNAKLNLSDGRIVDITSNKGRYNKVTNDCFFEEKVKASDGETIITADNLDLISTRNYVEIYNNVRLNHTSGSLRADKIDYDFETKNFKVSMLKDKKVKMKVIK